MISLDTAKTILLPVSLYQEGLGEGFLRFNGMEPAAGERVVVSGPQDGMVAVMAVKSEEADRCTGVAGVDGAGEEHITSPLLEIARHGRGREVRVLLTARNVYLAVWDDGLQMAEALPDNSVDSILYYMQVVGREFKLRKFDIHVSGERAGLVADALRRYYKKVKVATS